MLLTSPDALYQSAFSNQIANLRTRLDEVATELATGRRQDVNAAVRGDNNILLRAEAAIEAFEPERARLNVLEGRFRTAGLTLRTVNDLAGSTLVSAQAAGDLAAGVDADGFAATEARTSLATMFSTLEARFGGRALFGGDLGAGQVMADVSVFLAEVDAAIGTLTDAASVEAAIDSVFAPGGGFEINVYLGGQPLGAQLSDGQQLAPIITADSGPMRQVFKGLAMQAFNERVQEDQRSSFLLRSAEVTQTARDALTAEEASIGLARNAIDREMVRQEALLFDANETVETILGRDPFEAASETQALEARLQAAYTITGRLAGLRLTNFLR
ncbi:hypothetical protein [Parvularcula lutaonensis]|uniref:Flagellin n=1 Tax=Parvularcula lutaonensis TaxID=491923 RepID=A0ABV7MB99_9PROT|nr:hypothetical protein [Parvularcula lutaonensis]GGY43802.1 hypothetical protein GCM10007148_10750 [Parvularcula lutaonensis]